MGWEAEFTVFILTFCLLLALGLTGIGRIMVASIWKQCQGRSLERGQEYSTRCSDPGSGSAHTLEEVQLGPPEAVGTGSKELGAADQGIECAPKASSCHGHRKRIQVG